MHICLVPRKNPQHGQDFRQKIAIKKLGLQAWPKQDTKGYDLPNWEKVKLIISFNPHDLDDRNFIQRAPSNIPLVVHHQLQRHYLTEGQQKNLQANLARANSVIIPAKFLANQLTINKDKISVVANGAQTKIFKVKNELNVKQWREQQSINPATKIAGFIGYPTHAKGKQLLSYLSTKLGKDWKIIIFSIDKPSSSLLNNNSVVHIQQDNVESHKPHVTPMFDLLLSLSLCEVAPMVIIESLLSGVPVIATDSTPYLDEITSTLPQGLLKTFSLPAYLKSQSKDLLHLKEKDVKTIGDKILAYTENFTPYDQAQKLELSKMAISNKFDAESMINEFKKIYNQFSSFKPES
jgi:glycosyltransferase involved in cell wall biosynthesis